MLEHDNSYTWNYANGNHLISLVKSTGEYGFKSGYYMLVHASANEFKKELYPNSGVWYENEICIEYDDNSNRYIRYISGDSAVRFYNIAKNLIKFNNDRNRYFIESVLGDEFLGKEIVSIQHYGMPNNHTVCIGVHWEPTLYTLLTSPGKPVFLVKPNAKTFAGSPHGLGLCLNNPKIKFKHSGIDIGNHFFSSGSIKLGMDAINRCSFSNSDLTSHISKILNICPGYIVGKLHQLVSISRDGTIIW